MARARHALEEPVDAAFCAPAVPVGVWAGWRLHERLDQRALYRAVYGILVVTAAKLLWDELAGYIRA
ncbi:sulfite exporter TauE/SafE family protein [Bradyrhizobium sp. CCBAU 051011]|uniref:sulfite exporter TauE/SafE family protein n=1 Tax=Bradyrhizobium sp. CCBAU 051011 TaxID=858422 RepID=UPI00192A4586